MFGPGGFRFLLAWMVVLDHVSRLNIGSVAVMAFFILSGYWVTRVFKESYVEGARGVQVFYASRFLRIWPVYAAVFLIVLLAMVAVSLPLPPDLWTALLIFGVATHGTDLLGVSWSLDIELQFYLLLPLIVLMVQDPRRDPRRAALMTGLAFLLWAAGLFLGGRYDVQTALIYLPLFVAGATVYLLELVANRRMALLSAGAFILAGLAAVAIPALKPHVISGSGNPFSDNVFALLWGLILVPFIAFNVRQRSSRTDRHLGNLSYVVYLVHFPMKRILTDLRGEPMQDFEKLVFFVAVMAVSLVIYAAFDAPFEFWRRRMIGRLQKPLSFQRAGG